MVDVSKKPWTRRRAVARAVVHGGIDTLREPSNAEAEFDLTAVLAAARAAGVEAARKTSQLIPLCHPLAVSEVDVNFEVASDRVEIESTAEVVGPTGVEMEALTACLTAALVLAASGPTGAVSIDDVVLWEKTGGRSGHFLREQVLPAG